MQLALCSEHQSDPVQAVKLLHQLHWLPVQQRITYKLAVLTYKVRSTSTPVYLHHWITERVRSRTLRSSAVPLLVQQETFPGVLSDFQHCQSGTRCHSDSLSLSLSVCVCVCVFKSRLKTFFIYSGFHWTPIRPAASASEVTTTWCCINSIIIIIIMTTMTSWV